MDPWVLAHFLVTETPLGDRTIVIDFALLRAQLSCVLGGTAYDPFEDNR